MGGKFTGIHGTYVLGNTWEYLDNIFISKINEFTHTIFPIFWNIRLYCETVELRNIINITYVTENFSNIIDSIISMLFNIINNHIVSDKYISYVIKNNDL